MTRARRKVPKATVADYAMPLAKLGPWLKAKRHPLPATGSLPALDGFVTTIVADPISLAPPDWVCPLLGVELDAFNHDNVEFTAIGAVGMRHNAISEILSSLQKGSSLCSSDDPTATSTSDPGAWASTPP